MIKKSIKLKPEMFFCWLIIFMYIVGGNAMTINFGERLPLKMAELVSIPFILFELIKYRKIGMKTLDWQILIWICLGTAAAVIKSFVYHYSFSDILYGVFYSVRLLHLIILINFLTNCFRRRGYSVDRVLSVILKLYLFVCAIGLFQLLFFPVAYDWYRIFFNMGFYFANPDPHQGRLVSTYFDPNFLACCLSIPLCISLNFWETYKKQKYLIYAAAYMLTCVLTVSRSGFLAMAIVVIIMLMKKRYTRLQLIRNLALITAAVAAVVFMYLNGTRIIERILNSSTDQNTFSRFNFWSSGWEIISKNAIIGVGYNMIGTYTETTLGKMVAMSTGYGNDSSLILIIETTGIVGIVYFIGVLIHNARKTHVTGMRKKLIIQMVVTALICCNFNNLLFYPLWLMPVLLIVHLISYYEQHAGAAGNSRQYAVL